MNKLKPILPKTWKLNKIGEVTKIINGGTPKTKIKKYWNGDIAWITPADMGKLKGTYVDQTSRTITEIGLEKSSAKIFPPNSVILSTRAPIGHLAINTIPMSTNQGCRAITSLEDLDYKYVFYFLRSNIDLLNKLGSGTTFKELSSTNLKAIPIPIPSLPEQKKIVSILDVSLELIDQAIANCEQNTKNTEELFQSILDDVFTNPGDDWQIKSLGEVCENLDRYRIPITKKDRINGEYPYYGATGIVDYVDDYIFDEDLLLISEDGANLLARKYPIAFSVNGKIWVNNHAHVLRFSNIHQQQFIESYINFVNLESYISGMAQPKLNQTRLKTIPVPWINDEQKLINLNNLIQSYKQSTDNIKFTLSKKISSLQELKQSLLEQAFQGVLTKAWREEREEVVEV